MPGILIGDDRRDVLKALSLLPESDGCKIEAASSTEDIINAIEDREFDVILMDLDYARANTSGAEGLDLLSAIRQIDSTLAVVVMTAWSSIEIAVEAMRRGRGILFRRTSTHKVSTYANGRYNAHIQTTTYQIHP